MTDVKMSFEFFRNILFYIFFVGISSALLFDSLEPLENTTIVVNLFLVVIFVLLFLGLAGYLCLKNVTIVIDLK